MIRYGYDASIIICSNIFSSVVIYNAGVVIYDTTAIIYNTTDYCRNL